MNYANISSSKARLVSLAVATMLAVVSSCLCSCSDEDYTLPDPFQVEEGIMTNVTLLLDTDPADRVTRAALSDKAERRIYDLVVYVFDRDGRNGRCLTFTNPDDTLVITLPSGLHRVYALANVVNVAQRVNLSKELNAIHDVESLKALTATLSEPSIYRYGGHLLMSCIYAGDQPTDAEGGYLVHPARVNRLELHMKHVSARVTFNVKATPRPGEDTSFTPTGWRVVNAATSAPLFAQPLTDAAHTRYFDMKEYEQFEGLTRAENGQETYSFTFYTFPNILQGQNAQKWADREQMKKDEKGINTSVFENAPETSTYVELTGYYNSEFVDSTGLECRQSAYVTYTIHLGNIGGDLNNYECRSNTHYTYNVEVRGINDIIAKVEAENPEDGSDPTSSDIGDGAIGDVVNARFVYNFDSHYDREIIEFSKDYIQAHPDLLGFYVKTPFDEGAYYIDTEGTESNPGGFTPASKALDCHWIQFRRCDMESDSVYNRNTYAAYNKSDMSASQLIYADQLIRELRSGRDSNGFSVFDRNGKACYTVYIDENYYTTDPRTGQEAPVDFWKQFVNCPSREFLLFCDPSYSADRRSSLLSAYIQIRQRAIRTIYDEKAGNDLQTAWGVESYNETGLLIAPLRNPWSTACSPDNALLNLLSQPIEGTKTIIDMDWDQLMTNTRTNGIYRNQLATLRGSVSPLLYACIQRNRDLNGDGKVSIDEIRWIPAALLQYQELSLGAASLPNECRLYPMGSTEYRRYLSSTGLEVMAEEGATAAPYGTLEALGLPDQYLESSFDYRCIRLLGIEHYTTESAPQPLIKVDAERHYVDVSHLQASCLRDATFYVKDEMESDAADNASNRPYTRGFYYADVEADAVTTSHLTLNAELDADGPSPCSQLNSFDEQGWRLPNEAELSILISNVPDGWDDNGEDYYISRSLSRSNLTGKPSSYYLGVSQMVNGKRQRYLTLPETGKEVKGRVRCVRDAR